MADFTDKSGFTASQVVDATDMNELAANDNYLKDVQSDVSVQTTSAQTISSASYTDVTNANVTITTRTSSTKVVLYVFGTINYGTSEDDRDIQITIEKDDGSTQTLLFTNQAIQGLREQIDVGGDNKVVTRIQPFSFQTIATGLTPNTAYTFTVQAKSTSGNVSIDDCQISGFDLP